MPRSFLKVIVAIVVLGICGGAAATVLAGDDGSASPPEPATSEPSASEPSTSLPPVPTGHESPGVPKYTPGEASVVPPDDPIAKEVNPDGDPNIRVCRDNKDGTYTAIITSPVDPKNPYPPGDSDRPC